jgi:hypothetical protein
MVFLVAAALLVGCSAGSSASTTSHPVTASSSAVGTAARATATPSAAASLRRGLLGVLAVPAGATPWPQNTTALMNRISFVTSFYPKGDRTSEETLNAWRGFVSAVDEGWTNADGSGQEIILARFATPAGATSASDEVSAWFKQWPKPVTAPTDPATGAVGYSNPRLDSSGDALVEFVAHVGDTMLFVNEWTAATPDPAAAKVLLQRQYDRLKNGS